MKKIISLIFINLIWGQNITIAVFDFENNNLLRINLNTGDIVQNISLLWVPNKITVKKEFVIVQSDRKLYLIAI